MQKKIIALAVAGLVSGAAFAQSNVQIYGILDIGYLNQNIDYSDSANNSGSADLSRTGFDKGALSTSRLGFKGEEALGNGLKANFVYELGIASSSGGHSTDTATALTTRQAYVGLSGNWGSFNIGRQAAVADDVWAIASTGMRNNAVGALYTADVVTNLVSGITGTTTLDAVAGIRRTSLRLSDAWTYRSPSMGGLSFAAQYGKAENDLKVNGTTNTDNKSDFYGLSAVYANGPINAGLAYGKEEVDTVTGSTSNNKQWTLGGSYDFGVAKVFAIYANGKNDATKAGAVTLADSNGWELGVHVPVTGAVTLLASYMDGKHKVGVNGVVGQADVDYKGYQLGALYSLSKRTAAYAMYGSLEGKWKETGFDAKADIDQFAIGLRHSF